MFEKMHQNFLEKDQNFVKYCEGLKDSILDVSFFFTSLDAIHILLENMYNIGTSQKEKLRSLEKRIPFYQEMRLIQGKLKANISSLNENLVAYSRLLQLVTMYDKLKNTLDFDGDLVKQIETFHKVQNQLNTIYQGLFHTEDLLEEEKMIPRLKEEQESVTDYLNYIHKFYGKEPKKDISSISDRAAFENNLAMELGISSSKEEEIDSLFVAPSIEIEDPVSLIAPVEPVKEELPTREKLEGYKEFLQGFTKQEQEILEPVPEPIAPAQKEIDIIKDKVETSVQKEEIPVVVEKKEETPEELLQSIHEKIDLYEEKTGICLFPNISSSFSLVREGITFPEQTEEVFEERVAFEPKITIGDSFQISLSSPVYLNPALGTDGGGYTRPLYAPSFERTVFESYFLDESTGAIRIANTNDLLFQYGEAGLRNIGVKGEDGYYQLSDVKKVSKERGL